MRRSFLASAAGLAGALAVLLSATLCPGQAAPPAADHAMQIGVVSTTFILRRMTETKKLESDFRARNLDLGQQQHQKEADLEQMSKHRDESYKPGSQQWVEETQNIDRKRAELEVWTSMSKIELDRWQKQSLKTVYDHISAAVAQVAQQQKLDIVIADQTPDIGPDLDKINSQQLQAALAARSVLYYNKKADISDLVLTLIEADFTKLAPGGSIPIPATGK